MQTKLSGAEIGQRLEELGEWKVAGEKLHREFLFADFSEAFGFMARVALAAEAMGHHPEWSNVWNRVVVDLCTHDAGGITASDFELAKKMEQISGRVK